MAIRDLLDNEALTEAVWETRGWGQSRMEWSLMEDRVSVLSLPPFLPPSVSR